jgi:hypothetical protein
MSIIFYKGHQLQGAIVGAIASWEKANNTSIEDAWGLDRREIAQTLYQIAEAESGGSNKIGDTWIKNDDLNASYSPWQINKQHTSQVKAGKQYDHTKLTNNPQYAALAAIEIANEATSSTGDPFARFFPWTVHRLTNPNDKGPFQFAGGSRAPEDEDREPAIAAFETGRSQWKDLDFSADVYKGYASPAALPQNPNLLGTDDDEGLGPIGDTGSIPSWKAPPPANALQIGNFKEKLRVALGVAAEKEYETQGLARGYQIGEGKGYLSPDSFKITKRKVTLEAVDQFLRGTGDGSLDDAQIRSLLEASLGGTSISF